MMDNLGYVVGVMLGDGSFGKTRGEDTRVQMNVKDREFAVRFAEALSKVVGSHVPMYERERSPGGWGTGGTYYIVQKGMKYTIPELKLLMEHDCIRRMPRKFKLGVISGLFDSDGFLSRHKGGRYPAVSFAVTDIELMHLWQDLCVELFGLHAPITGPNMAGTNRTTKQYSLSYCGMEKCSKFFAEIPITIDRKRDRWQKFLEGKTTMPYVFIANERLKVIA